MSRRQAFVKRTLDLVGATVGLLLSGWLILLCWLLATFDTRRNGFFRQQRIGRHGRPFRVVKIRSMRAVSGMQSTVTTRSDARITRLGGLLRRSKLDELPQLWNVLLGQMSFVGPRPDVAGYADRLNGPEARLLALRPGITGLASVAYRDEEEVLARQADPQRYNDEILWPAKVRLNLVYLDRYSLRLDLLILLATLLPGQAHRLDSWLSAGRPA